MIVWLSGGAGKAAVVTAAAVTGDANVGEADNLPVVGVEVAGLARFAGGDVCDRVLTAGVTGGARLGDAGVVETVDHPVAGAGVTVGARQVGHRMLRAFAFGLTGQAGVAALAIVDDADVVEVHALPFVGAQMAAVTAHAGGG